MHRRGREVCAASTAHVRACDTRLTLLGSGTMERKDLLRRITVNPAIFGGKPIVRGMRIPVDLIFALLAEGETVESVLDAYPDLERDDLRACFAFAHALLANESLEAVELVPA
jgi:uncharacterized protein (DUF433 family)